MDANKVEVQNQKTNQTKMMEGGGKNRKAIEQGKMVKQMNGQTNKRN